MATANPNFQPPMPGGPWGLWDQEMGTTASAVTGNILVVDALESRRRAARAALAECDYEMIEAGNTSEAISALSLRQVDLVLADLRVPELGGVEFCRMLKKASATQFLPVFIVTSADDVEQEVLAIEAGADAFLVNPLRPKALRARVQASLRHKSMIESIDDSETVLFSLAQSVEERDPPIAQHCQRLALMAAAMGIGLGLPRDDIFTLQRGGYLHDIGKVAIPDRILFKPGPLTPDEWHIMKSHAVRGERICASMRSLAPVLPIIRHHHERWDGSGYPDGLKDEQIPLLARILQIADIFDALTTARPYKPALSTDESLSILRAEVQKGWRDPKLVELFADVLPTFRVPAAAEVSRLSLHALAASIDRYRRGAHRLGTDAVPELAGLRSKARAL
ncbi:MAG TPA: HD domain-containing phosphohydrolase [Bryobacteraceae bacterium]